MKTLNIIYGSLLIGFLLISLAFSSSAIAQEVNGPGEKPTHKHVYKSSSYGKGVIIGHYAQPEGSRGIVIWQASPYRSYGKAQPGFKIPRGHAPQLSQKLMYQQKPAFSNHQRRAPNFGKQ